jgi:hypothetical protein
MSADPAEIEIRRAPRIKAEDVFQAADALLVDGHRPTIDRVRMKLGRGSPNTINEHLDAWWSTLGARLRDLPGQVLPGLPDAVTTSLVQLWNLAVRESHQALLSSLQERETAYATTASELDQRAAAIAERERALQESRAALESALVSAQRHLEETQRRGQQLEAELRAREETIALLTARESDLRVQVEALRGQVQNDMSTRLAEQVEQQRRAAADEARALREIDRARQESKEALRRAAVSEKALQARAIDLERLQRTLHTTQQNLASAQAQAAARAEQLSRLEQILQSAQPPLPAGKRGSGKSVATKKQGSAATRRRRARTLASTK